MTTPTTPDTPPRPGIDDLRLGQIVQVQVAPGVVLRNTEAGGAFEPGMTTPQTVTPTLLRRLRDGDLTLIIPLN